MPRILQNIAARVRDLFQRAPQPPPHQSRETLGGGHRGVAIGDANAPDYSQENVDRWRALPASDVEAFVYEEQPLFVHSTNVAMAQYFFTTKQMMVEFLGGGAYLYDGVTEDEAIQFAKAPSKGGWVWDNLRVRGSRNKHKKPFRRLR